MRLHLPGVGRWISDDYVWGNHRSHGHYPVSYTHLDVYKRQTQEYSGIETMPLCLSDKERRSFTEPALCQPISDGHL